MEKLKLLISDNEEYSKLIYKNIKSNMKEYDLTYTNTKYLKNYVKKENKISTFFKRLFKRK